LVNGVEPDPKRPYPDAVPAEVFGSVPSISLAEVNAMGCRDGRHAFWKTRGTGKAFVIRSKNGEAAFRSFLDDGFSEANIKQAMERAPVPDQPFSIYQADWEVLLLRQGWGAEGRQSS
jgi:hypothetical protein